MRRRTTSGTVVAALGLVVMLSGQAAAAVSWSAAKTVSAQHGFNTGVALATTKSGSTTYLHQVYVNQYPGGHHANDAAHGPREAIMYQRRSASGASSGPLVRVNSATQHGFDSAIAASGEHVYAVWVHLAKYDFLPATPRTLQFRANAHNGSGSWGAVKNLAVADPRVDQPAIAAAGSYVYISYANEDTGAVHLLISSDYGAHFHDSGLSMANAGIQDPLHRLVRRLGPGRLGSERGHGLAGERRRCRLDVHRSCHQQERLHADHGRCLGAAACCRRCHASRLRHRDRRHHQGARLGRRLGRAGPCRGHLPERDVHAQLCGRRGAERQCRHRGGLLGLPAVQLLRLGESGQGYRYGLGRVH